jgi:Tol biopolymer transport system component
MWKNQIDRLDLNSGATARLTKGDSYNEHPRYTPDGQVLWMSSADNSSRGTDWWTMNADGSNPQRLSDFNSNVTPATLAVSRSTPLSFRPPIGAPTIATSTAT